ncbi:hypothetical protein BCR33DRAFT_720646 [Rhizoclosmatium globosum]|uniref:Uncharacterized protein n=1 Tax=Rhizoclosmatium globosum TaxID=329046 RepID=A0A1Y2BV43_9FUNG|nr:hypothetical protein HDU99_002789 [Rhizoclosmatium hyalinum]ORY38631.1 hypothetical protein BCR33DRAFT_720646 [Rhizoclosmatium globosum]|eukprot:ORY38631.1 hypothetical protein BCR33DRAFT_720646 [Rhizoclosmatium globosum]
MATNTLVAQARHKDDVWNAPYAGFVTGLAAGARAGSPQKIVFFSVAFSGLALWGKFFSTELKENFSFNRYEKKHNAPPVFVGNERDPYKERWAKIQAREEAAADEE